MSSIPQFPIGNIYAPPWMCVSPSVAGYQDVAADVTLPNPNTITGATLSTAVTVPAATIQPGSPTNGQTLALDADYDFLCREIQFVVFPPDASVQPSDLRCRIRDPFGRLITNDYVQVQNLCGALPFVWGLKKAGILTFDFQNVNADNAISVQVVLRGWKRMACPGAPAIPSPYAPMYRRYSLPQNRGVRLEDYEYYYTFVATQAGDLLRVPLPTDQDADFLWRGIQGDWNTSNNDVAVVGDVGVGFRNPTGVALSGVSTAAAANTAGLLNPWGSPNVAEFRESIFSAGGGMPAPIYPEILIPRGGTVEVDLSFGGAATLRFSLRGMKIYREGC